MDWRFAGKYATWRNPKMTSLIHELRVHQIELEMQNEELRHTQNRFENTRARYADLYDFAPVGYFSMNQKGVIDEANLTIATMLGVDGGTLIGQAFTRFVQRDFQDTFYKNRQWLLETEAPQSFELGLVKKDGRVFYARLECTMITNQEEDGKQIRVAVSDITERKQAEDALRESEKTLKIA
jgi:PAS domain S-box-containing protein